jgi:nicotinamidase-related amidase
MLIDVEASQLVLVDYQQRLMPAMHDGAAVIAQAERLARAALAMQVPVVATEQNPDKLGPTVPALQPHVQRTLAKMHFDATAEGLVDLLRAPAPARKGASARSLPRHLRDATAAEPRDSIVIAGCEAHVCLLQSALGLLDADFDVWVVTDACSSRSERNRDAAFDRLAAAGVELVTAEMVMFEWLRTAAHPQFKALQQLIK